MAAKIEKKSTSAFGRLMEYAGRFRVLTYLSLINLGMINLLTVPVERMNEITDHPAQTGTTDFHPAGYDIRFESVGFSYDQDKTVLRDVTFTAKQGEVTALVGPSGGGKTTVSRLAHAVLGRHQRPDHGGWAGHFPH